MNSNKKRLIVCFIAGCIVAILALVCHFRDQPATELSVVVEDLAIRLSCIGLTMVAVVPFAGIFLATLCFLDWSTMRTRIYLWSNRLSARIAAQNALQVYPCLQNFLYYVLSQNRNVLSLPLGRDASCLIPCGYAPAYRSGCVFYRFQLVTPEKPEVDTSILRLIIQNYITSELISHGIEGLPDRFQSADKGIFPSVFLDRIFYEDGRHYLTFDLLFVGNEECARYVHDALNQDINPKQVSVEVSDDDL